MSEWKYTRLSGTNILVEWSVDKLNWVKEATDDCIWMRTSNNGGLTWKESRVVGESGDSALLTSLDKQTASVNCNYYRKCLTTIDIPILFRALLGNSRVACTISVDSLPAGVLVKSNTPGTKSKDGEIILTIATGADLGGIEDSYNTVIINFKLTANNITLTHQFSLNKVMEGDSVKKIIWLYQRSNNGESAPSIEGVTNDISTWGNWKDKIESPNSTNKYIWGCMIEVKSSNNKDNPAFPTSPSVVANFGERGSSDKTIGIKSGYNSFSTYLNGKCYVHGYDETGKEADINGYIEYNGYSYYIKKGVVFPDISVDGYLIIKNTSSLSDPEYCYTAFYDFTDENWYYFNNITSGDVNKIKITESDKYIAFATYKSKSNNSSIEINKITPLTLDLISTDVNFHYDGIALNVNSGKASFSSLKITKSNNKYVYISNNSKTASYGSVVFVKGGDTNEPSTSDVKDIYVFNGSYWLSISGKKYYDNCVSLVAGDLPSLAGVYCDNIGTSAIPPICGTYIKTLTANQAFINELVANDAFINKLTTNSLFTEKLESKYATIKYLTGGDAEFKGKVTATSGEFNGLIKQGCNFYIAARCTIISDGKTWTISSNNKKYESISKLATGRLAMLLDPEDVQYGVPRVICHYCSDVHVNSTAPATLVNIANETYYPGYSNPKYQITCSSGNLIPQVTSTMDFLYWLPLYFTDNNSDQFVDPMYVVITLIYI